MSSNSTKKPTPGAGASARKGANNSSTESPSRSPSRTGNANGAATAPALNRTRSSRTGTPVSARAAARKPPAATDGADDDAKAELQAKVEEAQGQLRKAEEDAEQAHQKAAVLEVKLDEALKEQGLLEEQVHEHLERTNDLENDKKESLRAKREMEQIFESERAAVMKEKEAAQAREDDLKATMQRLKETLAQKELRAGLEDDGRPGVQRNSSWRKSLSASPTLEMGGQFAPPTSLERSDSRSSSKLVMQKDKIIEELRLEVAEAQIRLVEMENVGGGRLQKLEKEMYEVKVQNARLMEENESFQLLLSERTLNGDFAHSGILRPSSHSGSTPPSSRRQGSSLADELEAHEQNEPIDDARKLQSEVTGLKDQNKALTLYINNIISRLLQHDSFEQILDKTPDVFAGPGALSARFANANKDLPPPPPEKDVDDQPQGFLQRARSVMGGRPKSIMQISDGVSTQASVHENPQTAPQIPLGRSTSVRTAGGAPGGHRRANSEWATASLVNSMYRGPSPSSGVSGPMSPGLSSPGARTGGFFASQPLAAGAPARVPSGSAIETIAEIEQQREGEGEGVARPASPSPTPPPSAPQQAPAQTQRDSKLIHNRNSIVSVPDTQGDGDGASGSTSNPSSPPRSVASGGEREARMAGVTGGSVMVGSKMRPLRLVREAAQEDDSARKAGNRGSWFGFLNKGV